MKGKYLITTNAWFYAPDGLKYRAVWGEVSSFDSKQVLGIETNKNSTNWYVKVGSEDKHIIIAGCQVQYAIHCESKPSTEPVTEKTYGAEGVHEYQRDTEIYISE